MAERFSDYYKDINKILTLLENGNSKEREIAIGSLLIYHSKERHFDLIWNIFISDENLSVRVKALTVGCYFASEKQLWEIVYPYVREIELKEPIKTNYSRILLHQLYLRNQKKNKGDKSNE